MKRLEKPYSSKNYCYILTHDGHVDGKGYKEYDDALMHIINQTKGSKIEWHDGGFGADYIKNGERHQWLIYEIYVTEYEELD